ncbi:MAG: hypothetical protein K2X57_29100 [Xanthobacteraceae bacterium]|nr:hypothetical protein [Xanthobacteraceae bacterium]
MTVPAIVEAGPDAAVDEDGSVDPLASKAKAGRQDGSVAVRHMGGDDVLEAWRGRLNLV